MTPAKPSLELLRSLTDEHVLRALMQERRLTRAELAGRTGISKPTVSESVRRLTEAGLLRDTGERTTGRGRIGAYYGLASGIGSALVVSISPDGVVAEALDIYGEVVFRTEQPVTRPARPAQVARALRAAARRAQEVGGGPARLAVVSAADPVDRATGRLVHLPDAPFLVGELSPAELLAPFTAGPVTVDNDVNWAARAERATGTADLNDYAYLYLGEGLGCAVVSDGEVRRGHGGLAGEVAHLVTAGRRGRAVPFTEVFAELGLRQDDSTAIDTTRLLDAIASDAAAAAGARTRAALADAICGVLTAIVALTDPEVVVLGGTWGTRSTIVEAVTAEFADRPRSVPVRAARVTTEPSLSGARDHALHDLRQTLLPHRRDGALRSTERASDLQQ